MSDVFHPTTDIDKGLLASIPQKVYGWLIFLASLERGNYHDLSWSFGEDESTVLVDGENPTQIWVKGPITKPTEVYGVESWMTDISNNLDKFIAYEKRIYDILEELTDQIQKENDPAGKFVQETTDLVKARND